MLLWLFDAIVNGIKGYFKFQVNKTTTEMKKPRKLSKKRQISRVIAILLMVAGAGGFITFLALYLTGNPDIPFKKGVIVSVVVFLLSYIWYSDKLQPGK